MVAKDAPQLRTADIMVWLYRDRGGRFTVRDIVQKYGIQRGEARRRVVYMLHLWGAAKEVGRRVAHRRGRREVEYELTSWGETYASKRLKSSGRVAANPKRR